jgi:hypothetical protein
MCSLIADGERIEVSIAGLPDCFDALILQRAAVESINGDNRIASGRGRQVLRDCNMLSEQEQCRRQ